ncbi:MAG: GGDEF domain-containing protein [Burkholderiales bacterium]|nr:GGDEF domain-containing protein [Burkholderiales bacterium]MBH2015441.1 GGDEF domain-containing protein [Burkholderiales bacterium]
MPSVSGMKSRGWQVVLDPWRVPPEWRSLYQVHRISEFRRLVDQWWPVPLLVHLAFTLVTVLTRWDVQPGPDEMWHLGLAACTGVLLALAAWLARRSTRLQVDGDRWMPWVMAAVVWLNGASAWGFSRQGMSDHMLLMNSLSVMGCFCSMRLSFAGAVKSTALGAGAGAIIWSAGRPDLALQFSGQFLMACGLGLLCVFLREDLERENFLNAVKLAQAESRLRAVNERLHELAHQDALTGLPNRRSLDQCMKREWQRAVRNRSELALLMIDVDHFKRYNDRHGHLDGDACLITVAQALRGALQRPADVIARYGGEEFVVLLPDTDLAGAWSVAQRLMSRVDELGLPHQGSDVASHVTVSVGGCVFAGTGHERGGTLLRLADEALYKAKSSGRHCVSLTQLD